MRETLRNFTAWNSSMAACGRSGSLLESENLIGFPPRKNLPLASGPLHFNALIAGVVCEAYVHARVIL